MAYPKSGLTLIISCLKKNFMRAIPIAVHDIQFTITIKISQHYSTTTMLIGIRNTYNMRGYVYYKTNQTFIVRWGAIKSMIMVIYINSMWLMWGGSLGDYYCFLAKFTIL